MNWPIFIGGLFALFATFGHLTLGNTRFLQPMLAASFDAVPKKVMHAVFHYITAFLLLSAALLIAIGVGFSFGEETRLAVWFIAANYTLFAVGQIALALTSGIPSALTKLFQWVFWVVIAVLAWIGA
jgi:hypothetical protein